MIDSWKCQFEFGTLRSTKGYFVDGIFMNSESRHGDERCYIDVERLDMYDFWSFAIVNVNIIKRKKW